jgi:TPR repeat protein
VDYLNHAATFFGDRDAQFELAKTYLGADGSGDDVKRGLHYLSVLTEESYPSAQALLADLLWRGRHVEKDPPRALALITMAAENAPAHERMWIEESYATIFCAATPHTRQEASAVAASWRKAFARPQPEPEGARDLLLERHCADGEKVVIGRLTKAEAAETGPPSDPDPVKGNTPPGIRAAGVLAPAAKKQP